MWHCAHRVVGHFPMLDVVVARVPDYSTQRGGAEPMGVCGRILEAFRTRTHTPRVARMQLLDTNDLLAVFRLPHSETTRDQKGHYPQGQRTALLEFCFALREGDP